jgi:lysophospholipase L1-like esterase
VNPGDYVFIEFGHNDEVPTKASFTPPADFQANLRRFIDEVQARKATPILMTAVARRKFDEKGVLEPTHTEYSALVHAVAADTKTPLLDLDASTSKMLAGYGVDRSRELFLQLKPGENPNYPQGVEDNTHFSPRGASEVATLVADALRTSGLALAGSLK